MVLGQVHFVKAWEQDEENNNVQLFIVYVCIYLYYVCIFLMCLSECELSWASGQLCREANIASANSFMSINNNKRD